MRLVDAVGQHAADDAAVFERIARAARRFRAVGEHAPFSVRRAREVDGGEMQIPAPLRAGAVTGAQKTRIGFDQRRRQDAFGDRRLRPVDVGQQRVEKLRALDRARLDDAPFLRRDQQRQHVERPETFGALRIVIDRIGDVVLAKEPARLLEAFGHLARIERRQAGEQRLPVLAQPPLAGRGLVIDAGPGRRSMSGRIAEIARLTEERGLVLRGAAEGALGKRVRHVASLA